MKDLLKLNLQLFAGEEGENEPTDDDLVENETIDTEDLEDFEDDEDDIDFDDTEEDDEEVEEKKVDNDTVKKHVDNIKHQKQQNYNNAKARIEKRRQEELAKAKREAYIEGIKKSTNGINTFTGQPIKDDVDVEVYETMCEMTEKGLDPVDDYYKYSDNLKEHVDDIIKIQEINTPFWSRFED